MKKQILKIREIESIEKELDSHIVGVLAVSGEDENIIQHATTFLYADKNIYVFINDEELVAQINFDNPAFFTIVNIYDKADEEETSYRFLSVSIKGSIKKIEEQKNIEPVVNNYLKKYAKEKTEQEFPALGTLLLIDTEEIQAFDEKGG